MNLMKLAAAFVFSVAFGAAAVCAEEAKAEGKWQVKLQNRLGLEKNVTVDSIQHDDGLVNLIGSLNGQKVMVALASDVFLGIPTDRLVEAALTNGAHALTLSDGEAVSGKMDAELVTTEGQRYDLRTVTKLVTLSAKRSDQEAKPAEKKEGAVSWELHLMNPYDKRYVVANPKFAFSYFSTEGYISGGKQRDSDTAYFHIVVDKEEILCDLADFEQITCSDNMQKITLKTKNGTETTGRLLLRKKDSVGEHESTRCIFFAELPNGTVIVLRPQTIWTLTKTGK